MTRLTYIAFCWMTFLCVLIILAMVLLAFVYGWAIVLLLAWLWGVSPLTTVGIVAFLAMTIWSGYRLYTHTHIDLTTVKAGVRLGYEHNLTNRE